MFDHLEDFEVEAVKRLRADLWREQAKDDPLAALERLGHALRRYEAWPLALTMTDVAGAVDQVVPTLGDIPGHIRQHVAGLCGLRFSLDLAAADQEEAPC